MNFTRREFVGSLTLAGAAGLLNMRPETARAEPPPETTRIRLVLRKGSVCSAPMYLCEDFLRREGFLDVQYVWEPTTVDLWRAVVSGEGDIAQVFSGPTIIRIDSGDPIVLLAGIHVGCLELFATKRVQAIRDLKGKTVAVPDLGGSQHVFLAIMAAYVGLEPGKDIKWVTHPHAESARLLAEGKVDAVMAIPPEPQELRAKKIGHVVVNSMMDQPWSQYFCCMLTANQQFVRQHPVATRRALRAILMAVDLCSREPERVAQFLVDREHTRNYDYALEAIKHIPYGKWRSYEAEDTIRFCALRLREVGMIKSSPQKIIAQGTDWRFLNELKKQLKA